MGTQVRPRNVDTNGIPGCQLDFYDSTGDYAYDGGDSLAIVGTVLTLTNNPIQFMKLRDKLRLFINDLGVIRRHPDAMVWYGQWDRGSRDQLVPLLCFLVMYPTSAPLLCRMVFESHRRNWFLWAWNTRGNGIMDAKKQWPDFTGPGTWALWIRIYKPWWASGVLWLLDLDLLLGSLFWKLKRSNVTRNHMLCLVVSAHTLSNPIVKLACWLTNWPKMIAKWKLHCEKTGEYQTWELFEGKIYGK